MERTVLEACRRAGNHSAVRLPMPSGASRHSGMRGLCGKLAGEDNMCGALVENKLVGVEHVKDGVHGEQVESVQVGGERAGSRLSLNSPAFHSI